MSGQSHPDIVVVGSGIIGASVAWNLQARGAQVTLVDAGLANATHASFGWINASYYHDAHHHALRAEGIEAYRRLGDRFPVPMMWCGSLCWDAAPNELEARAKVLRDFGYPVDLVDTARISVLEPAVAAPPAVALRFPSEAAVDQDGLVATLVSAATAHGLRVMSGLRVDGLAVDDGRVTGVRLNGHVLQADQVLLAAGTGTPDLLQDVGVALPLLDRPALVLRTRPVRPSVAHILSTDVGDIRQLPDGSVLMPAAAHHQSDDAERVVGAPHVLATGALERLRGVVPALDLRLAQVTLAHRPVPQDGLPAVGAVAPGLYTAVLHSGITLAAIMGELVAEEMLEGASDQTERWLAPYRPERFQTDRTKKGAA